MTRSPDESTRATRDAANVAAIAVIVYAVLWTVSTQIAPIRAASPFADDPWDAFASYATIFLPVVALATWIRSLGHRERTLPVPIAARIRWGSGLAAGIVLIASAADAHAIATTGFAPDAGRAAALLTDLVAASIVVAIVSLVLTIRAAVVTTRLLGRKIEVDAAEPDVVDDLLQLASDTAAVVGLRRPVDRIAATLESFLDRSPASPRRHRWLFGLALGVAAAIAFVGWRAFREGPWASAAVPVIVGILFADGILAAYFGTVVPLRLLRPQPTY